MPKRWTAAGVLQAAGDAPHPADVHKLTRVTPHDTLHFRVAWTGPPVVACPPSPGAPGGPVIRACDEPSVTDLRP